MALLENITKQDMKMNCFLSRREKDRNRYQKARHKGISRIGTEVKRSIKDMFGEVKIIESTSMLRNPDDPNEGNKCEIDIELEQGDKVKIAFLPDKEKKGVILAEGKKTKKDGSPEKISEAVAHRVYVLIEDTRKKFETWLAKSKEEVESFRIEKRKTKGEPPTMQVLIYLNDKFNWITQTVE